MQILWTLLLLSVTGQGLATALRNQVHSLAGKKLSSSSAIVASINKVDKDGRNALHHAVMLGDLPLVEFFLANGANTKAVDNDDLMPLCYAERLVEQQPSVTRMQIVSLVLEKTRGINRNDSQGWPPIVWSLMAGDYPRLIELLDQDANVLIGYGQQNAVWAAEHLEDDRAIKIIAGYVPDWYYFEAVDRGYQKSAQAMIERGLNPATTKDKNNFSQVMRAVRDGRVTELQTLIDRGAKIDTATLFLAISSENPNLVKTIIEHNAELASELVVDILNRKRRFLKSRYFSGISVSRTLRTLRQKNTNILQMTMEAIDGRATFASKLKKEALVGELADSQRMMIDIIADYLQDDEVFKVIVSHLPDNYRHSPSSNDYRKLTQAMIDRGINLH